MAKSTKPITEIFSITADTILIRPWQESDRPFLRTLFLHARREAWAWLDSSAWQLEDFDAATLDEEIWVAEQDGHRLGFASVSTNDNFLHNLFVDPNYQSLGVGHVLLEHVQKTFTSTGSLKCLVKNERAVAFYQRHGWHIEATGDSPDGEYYLMHYRLG
ncbi:GNAT family N-acetyltransferase [Enterobacter hormaechei]|nr:GNAT family N-acetyltransferase [Enterobacter hormaechei]HCM9628019.1 GNAT family N-acetyltransferase [Enterobacter hormaechei subsp. steigerwaltii]